MKALHIGILSVMLLASCGNSGKDSKKNEQPKEENIVAEVNSDEYVETINYKDFTKKVWDIDNYPDSVVLKSDLPCIIDFYADWCGPCKKVAPIMEELAKEYDGKINIYKVNTDLERKLAYAFKIQSIPTVFFFPTDGQPMSQIGALSKEDYVNIINKYLLP